MRILPLLLSLSAVAYKAPSAFAKKLNMRAFNRIVVFGDSISDTDNSLRITDGRFPPASMYENGRYTNGKVWVEYLQEQYNIILENYAVGGSTSNNTVVPGILPVIGMLMPSAYEQVKNYYIPSLSKRQNIVTDALHIVETANNDYIYSAGRNMASNTTLINGSVDSIMNTIDLLRSAAGARSFLVLGVGGLENIPYFRSRSPAVQESANQATTKHNSLLYNRLLKYQKIYPNIDIYYFNLKTFMNEVITNGKNYGLKNTQNECLILFGILRCFNPEEYFFWDIAHPTTTIHKLLLGKLLASTQTVL
ncbi:GDSL lipase/esterase [Syncephalis fuscata]|nr:GDSL lipase/esterase [Syncephalis fuscata]